MKLVLAAIMCPTFCLEEPPPLCEVEQPCDIISSENGAGGIPFLPIPLFGINTGGGHEPFIPMSPKVPEMPELPYNPPWTPPITPPILPPENPSPTVVPEPSSLTIMGLVGVIGLLTMRVYNGTSNP